MYLGSTTRPDISFVVSKFSRFVSNQERIIGKLLKEYLKVIVKPTGFLMLMRFMS
jgi:hypothetical protein